MISYYKRRLEKISILFLILSGCSVSQESIAPENSPILSAQTEEGPSIRNFPEADTTYMSYTTKTGYAFTYYGIDRKSWSWIPDFGETLPSEWRIKDPNEKKPKFNFCDRLLHNHFAPSRKANEEHCNKLMYASQHIAAGLKGDIFNLSKGTVPYVRDPCDRTNEFDKARYYVRSFVFSTCTNFNIRSFRNFPRR